MPSNGRWRCRSRKKPPSSGNDPSNPRIPNGPGLPVIVKIDPENPDPAAVRAAAGLIRDGKVVVFPTSGLYGLAADALNPSAVARVFAVKHRAADKPLSILIPDRTALVHLVREVPPGPAPHGPPLAGRGHLCLCGRRGPSGRAHGRQRQNRRPAARPPRGRRPGSRRERADHRHQRQSFRPARLLGPPRPGHPCLPRPWIWFWMPDLPPAARVPPLSTSPRTRPRSCARAPLPQGTSSVDYSPEIPYRIHNMPEW